MEVAISESDLTLPEFFREFRLRHAIAMARELPDLIARIESNPSRTSNLERIETRGVIRGRLDTPRYLAQRSTVRSHPRRLPIVQNRIAYTTPENALARLAIAEVHGAVRDNPFRSHQAEAMAANESNRWVSFQATQRPWSELIVDGSYERLYDETVARIRRNQTSDNDAYSRLLVWWDKWKLDLHRLGALDSETIIQGLLAFPGGSSFWDKVFEVWCLRFVASTLDKMGWRRTEGPVALHRKSGIVYRYSSPSGINISIQFQTQGQLLARWNYRGGRGLTGIPDLCLVPDKEGQLPLLIDAKNRTAPTSEETYKMLGYAENFRAGGSNERFRAILLFPAEVESHQVIDGPNASKIDIITVNLMGDREPPTKALSESIDEWTEGLEYASQTLLPA